MVSGIDLLARASFIQSALYPLKEEGIEYEFVTSEGEDPSIFLGLNPNFYATVADHVRIYTTSPFFKRKKEVARIHYWEDKIRLEVFDKSFKNSYEGKLQKELESFDI